MSAPSGLPVLVELVRSGVVERTHTGSVVLLRPDGVAAVPGDAAAVLGRGRRAAARRPGGRRRATMNCSGQHAAMLAFCVAGGEDIAAYLAAGSAVQRAIRATIERLADEPVRHVAGRRVTSVRWPL